MLRLNKSFDSIKISVLSYIKVSITISDGKNEIRIKYCIPIKVRTVDITKPKVEVKWILPKYSPVYISKSHVFMTNYEIWRSIEVLYYIYCGAERVELVCAIYSAIKKFQHWVKIINFGFIAPGQTFFSRNISP